ncbi:MAG TPA: hypothetical protein VIE65_21060 [Methylobacter sp.]|jgi:hypothetical protein
MKEKSLVELMSANPKARAQENVVREALAAIRMVRELGVRPKGYTLSSPFAKRGRLKAAIQTRKLKQPLDA